MSPGRHTSRTRQLGTSGSLASRSSCPHPKVWQLSPTELPDSSAHRWVVIDHEYSLLGFLHDSLPLLGGRVNCIVDPLPSFGLAQSVPPWASMIVRLIESPRPMPSDLVVKKGSKIRSAYFGSSPVPESRTAITTSPDLLFRDEISSSRGWLFTALIASLAFSIRFRITCCN